MANQIDERVKPFEVKMGKSIASLDSEFGTIRAGRANPHVLDRITVDYYGTPTPLQQVANIYLLHKIDSQCRCICQVVRSQRKVLNRVLIQHCRSQLEHVRRLADGTSVVRTVVTLVQQCTAKLHTADGIADKRM